MPNPNIFVAVGQAQISSSPDGVSWTSRSTFSASNRAIVWCEDTQLFHVAGYFGNRAWSSDGITWTTTSWTTGTTGSWGDTVNRIIYNTDLGLFFTVGEGTGIQSSPDFSAWTLRHSYAGFMRGLVWAKSLGVGVATDISRGVYISNADGTSWTASTITTWDAANPHINDLAWSEQLGLLVAVGKNGQIGISTDGTTWQVNNIPYFGTATIWSIDWIYELGVFVATGDGGLTATSPDGISWAAKGAYGGRGANYSPVIDRLVTVSGGTAGYYTDDLTTWTSATQPGDMNDVAWSRNPYDVVEVSGSAPKTWVIG